MIKRFLYRCGIALFISFLYKIVFFRLPDVIDRDLLFISMATLIILEGNLMIDKALNKRLPWLQYPQKRLLLQSAAFTVFTSITLYPMMLFLHHMRFGDGLIIDRRMRDIFFPTLLFSLTFIIIYTSIAFFNAWKNSLLEIEKYKTLSAEAQLQNLKSQINPHFLFNNLSVLTSLVLKNQHKAVDFINELSKVYRYILDNKNSELVTLQEELDFIDHYIYLLKIRFDNAISFSINIDENKKNAYIPPLCLQMLVENSIQHNEASSAKTLFISIFAHNDSLAVENNIQGRMEKAESSKTGLKNIVSRYAYFTDKKVEIINNGKTFKVTLPLIHTR